LYEHATVALVAVALVAVALVAAAVKQPPSGYHNILQRVAEQMGSQIQKKQNPKTENERLLLVN
jgi:hypothetical protein